MVVWAAVGGRASLLGACIGAILVNILAATVSDVPAFVEAWKAVLGLIFVLVVVFLPHGLAGFVSEIGDRLVRRRAPSAAPQPVRATRFLPTQGGS
jgi:urea transport system permease protein